MDGRALTCPHCGDIEQELREREAVERDKRRTGWIVILVLGGLTALVFLALLLAR